MAATTTNKQFEVSSSCYNNATSHIVVVVVVTLPNFPQNFPYIHTQTFITQNNNDNTLNFVYVHRVWNTYTHWTDDDRCIHHFNMDLFMRIVLYGLEWCDAMWCGMVWHVPLCLCVCLCIYVYVCVLNVENFGYFAVNLYSASKLHTKQLSFSDMYVVYKYIECLAFGIRSLSWCRMRVCVCVCVCCCCCCVDPCHCLVSIFFFGGKFSGWYFDGGRELIFFASATHHIVNVFFGWFKFGILVVVVACSIHFMVVKCKISISFIWLHWFNDILIARTTCCYHFDTLPPGIHTHTQIYIKLLTSG